MQLRRAAEFSSLLLGNKTPQNLVTAECEEQTGGHLWFLVSVGLPSGCQLGPVIGSPNEGWRVLFQVDTGCWQEDFPWLPEHPRTNF